MCDEELNRILSHEVCENLITKKLNINDFIIINKTIKPLAETPQGFTGTHYFLQFEIITKNQFKIVKFFLKLKFDPSVSTLLSDGYNDIYGRESEFLKIATKFNVDWAPKFYGFIENRLLILENLNERGFHIENGTLDMEHCFVALQTLAKFHAFYFQMIHEKKQVEPDYSILKEYPNFFQEVVLELETENGKQWFQYTVDSVKCILNGMPTSNSKIESKIVEKLYDLCEFLKPVENQYNVISHGDLWTNNIMFSSENGSPKNCCFIDYQLLRFLPLGNDVLTLLHLNTSPEFRRKNDFKQFFDYYYQQFTDELNKIGLDSNVIYPMDVYEASINNSVVPVLLMNCLYKPFTLMDKNRMGQLASENSDDLWFSKRTEIIQHELDIDENYKRAMFDEFQILIDEIVKIL